MNRERWRQIRAVLEPALEVDPAELSGWLDAHCPPELRSDVEGLIEASDTESTLLDEPVFRADAPLEKGEELGPYEIEDLIGVGGMGVVYRAKDSRLGRTVAVKVLSFGATADDMLTEARSASALNHPNIVVVHDVLQLRDAPAIIMEFVAGKTLADRLEAGGVRRGRAADWARQIAAALAAAHEAGILHRDLKPANIIVRPDGILKVLDFGIARPEERVASGRARPAGTDGYAAPEQLSGEGADARADIYAFGAVLRDIFETVGAAPPRWRALIERCTAHDAADRVESMAEVLEAVTVLERRERRPRRAALVAAAAVTVAVAVTALAMRSPDMPPSYSTRGLPGTEDWRRFPTIAPDGSAVVFSAPVGDHLELFRQDTGLLQAVPLDQEGRHAAWSPDGTRLAFRSDREGGGIFVMQLVSVDGVGVRGEVRRVTSDGYHPTWSPGSDRIAYSSEEFVRAEERATTNSVLSIVDASTRVVTPLTELAVHGDAIQPAWSPDGQHLAYWSIEGSARRSVWTIPAAGGVATRVTANHFSWSPAWDSNGWLYWASNEGGTMIAHRSRIDRGGAPRGERQAVLMPTNYASHFSFARNGVMAFLAQAPSASIWRARLRSDDPAERLTARTRRVIHPSVSPDGDWLVAFEEMPRNTLVTLRTDGSDFGYLTEADFRDRGPVWSPLGDEIAFGTNRAGQYEIWRVNAAGTHMVPAVSMPDGAHSPIWSPDGERIAWFTKGFRPYVSAPDGSDAMELPSPPTPGFRPTSWSSDGRRLAGVYRDTEGRRLQPGWYDFDTHTYTALDAPCGSIQWLPDATTLLCVSGRDLFSVNPDTGNLDLVRSFPYEADTRFDVSPDGEWVYVVLREHLPEIWIATPDVAPGN